MHNTEILKKSSPHCIRITRTTLQYRSRYIQTKSCSGIQGRFRHSGWWWIFGKNMCLYLSTRRWRTHCTCLETSRLGDKARWRLSQVHWGIQAPPMFSDKLSGIMVSIYKTDDDFYSELELDARMIKIIKHIQKSGLVSNKDVQAISGVSKATATRLL